MSWFYSSLIEDKVGEIVGYDTAYEIWEALRIVYESSSTTQIMGEITTSENQERWSLCGSVFGSDQGHRR